MMVGVVSEAERVFIRDGAEAGLRSDGRGPDDFRPIRLETGLLANTNGSARIRLGTTDVLVGVKAQLGTPADPPTRLQFFVDCSANATPHFEGRGGEEIGDSLSAALGAAYDTPGAIDEAQLVVHPTAAAWTLFVDVVLLELGGNLFDAVSLAVKAALFDARLPRVRVLFNEEKEEHEVELAEEEAEERLDLDGRGPLLVTVAKLGTANLVDPTDEEGRVATASLLVGVLGDGDKIGLIQQGGEASLEPDSVTEMLSLGLRCGRALNAALMAKLREEETHGHSKETLGFLTD